MLIKNIKELVQVEDKPVQWVAGKDMAKLQTIKDAYLAIEGDKIAAFGEMKDLDEGRFFRNGNYACLRQNGFSHLVRQSHTFGLPPKPRDRVYRQNQGA